MPALGRAPVEQLFDPGRIAGMSEIIADAVQLRFITAPLTAPQIKELVQQSP